MASNGTAVLLYIGTDLVASQTGLNITETMSQIKARSKDGGAFSSFVGAQEYAGSISCDALYVESDAAHAALLAAVRVGSAVTVLLKEDGTSFETVDARVTSFARNFPHAEVQTFSATIEFVAVPSAV
jgi:hypothetical protein